MQVEQIGGGRSFQFYKEISQKNMPTSTIKYKLVSLTLSEIGELFIKTHYYPFTSKF